MGHRVSLFDGGGQQVAMLGLDNAGKSTIVYRLKMHHFVQQAPTVGFNCEKFRPSSGLAKGQLFTIWDVGGQEKLRPLWRSYVRQTDAVIYVVDSTDVDRFEESRLELASLLRLPDLPPTVPVVLMANKQDLPEARSPRFIQLSLGLENTFNRPFHVISCCGVTGEGLDDTFAILYELIQTSRL